MRWRTGEGVHNENQPKRDLLAMTLMERETFTFHVKTSLEQRVKEVKRRREEYLRKIAVRTKILAFVVCGIVAYELLPFFVWLAQMLKL